MKLHYIPLLQLQRDLHAMPRGMGRFKQYIRAITNADGTGLELPPLVIMNPMGKEHVAALLDGLLALDADAVAAEAVAEASAQLAGEPGEFKVGLVIADDLKGGWTNRYASEFNLRFPSTPHSTAGLRMPKWLKDAWITAVLWSSEPATELAVREAVMSAIYRTTYILRHGPARTLRDKLAQEGHVLVQAGCAAPVPDEEEIAYTREVLAPFLNSDDMRMAIECLFGDAAGRTLGFTARGLSPWAGLALARHDARQIVRRST